MMAVPCRILLGVASLLAILMCHSVAAQRETEWLASEFPNPRKPEVAESNDCGRGNKLSWICNSMHSRVALPDNEADHLDSMINVRINTTRCMCGDYQCTEVDSRGPRLGIAILESIKPYVEGRSGGLVDAATHNVKMFSRDLQKVWELGACQDDVVVVYERSSNVFYTWTGTTASQRLTPEIIGDIAMKVRQHILPDRTLYEGLKLLIEEYYLALEGNYQMSYELPKQEPVVGESKGGAQSPLVSGAHIMVATVISAIFALMVAH